MENLKLFLEHIAYQLRVDSIRATTAAGSGHPTSCLSAADLVAALFFHVMRFDPKNIENPNNDRFILSKGHAAPLLYAAWKHLSVITDNELLSLRKFDSVLEGHPTPRFKFVEAATGSLGQGLSIAAGMAYAARMDNRDYITYVLLGDSEITEGSIWEAAQISSFYKLNNLVAIIDANRLGQSTPTIEQHHVEQFEKKFSAFGFNCITIDGHDMQQIIDAFDKIKEMRTKSDLPTMIIAKTFKGYGVARAENKEGFHGIPFAKENEKDILQELKNRFPSTSTSSKPWIANLPKKEAPEKLKDFYQIPPPSYSAQEKLATRKAYGNALVELFKDCNKIVSLDAEVKNSTFAQTFEKKYPTNFIQCFIAEQNMISMAVGLARRGYIPFCSTFACFLTRAFDQIRMAAIGLAPLRLVGSHAGVSIGQDGPSQMGLEDIAMMRAVPNSIVLYPSDAVSTHKLVELMANYKDGISYLRTTRMDTPVLYENNEQFSIGGCKVLRESNNDVACIVAAGITLFEALKAYEKLKKDGFNVAVIDLYSIKPLDAITLEKVAAKAQNRIITVEDHYRWGGVSEAVFFALRNLNITIESLAVTKLPRSGDPDTLLAFESINADAIIRTIKKICRS